jgi:hypothetical protein
MSIVQSEKPITSAVNPFGRSHAPDHLSAGTVTIESERAIAEAQGKLVIAKRFPRDQARAYDNIIEACKRPMLAEEACYSFPRGGQVVSGPAIRLAEMLAANWGNLDYGLRELSRKEGVSEMEAYAWDLETNVMSSQKFTVRHLRDKQGGAVALKDERDIYELTANMGARRLRARILAVLPADIVQAAVDQCTRTLASGGEVPIADRIRQMLAAFKTLGVPAALIEKRLGHSLDNLTGEELADLRKIHNSLRDNMSKLSDWFWVEGGAAAEDDVPYSEEEKTEKRPVARQRSSKGAATVATNPPRTVTPENPPSTVEAELDAVPLSPDALKPTPPDKLGTGAISFPTKTTSAAGISEPAPDVGNGRAFLKDGELLDAPVTLVTVATRNVTINDATKPSVTATVKGHFNGTVYGHGMATPRPDSTELDAAAIWKEGASVVLSLRGHKAKNGQVIAVVTGVREGEL